MIIWTFFLFLAAGFLTLPRNLLLNDDAALYALMAKNAIVHHQWLVQYITPGDPASFLDKPPLGIWLLAWLPKLIGLSELTIHLPNLLYYCLLLGLMYWAIAKFSSKKLAIYSTLIAATSLALVVYSRTPKLDVPLTLFVLAANFSLFAFLKDERPRWLYFFALMLAAGFLVKSGFGLLMPALTILGVLLVNGPGRQKLLKAFFSKDAILSVLLLAAVVGAVLGLQALVLKEQWLPYLKSITIQGKYNAGYLGFGFNSSIILLLLITIFPWTPAFLAALAGKRLFPILKYGELFRFPRIHSGVLNLNKFSAIWFWSNFLFLLFFYKQTDFRTFTLLVPPLAVLAAIGLSKGQRGLKFGVNFLFLFIFAVAIGLLLVQPTNPQGIDLSAVLLPVGLFTFSLLLLAWYFLRPSSFSFATSFAFICLAYVGLFWSTLPLANAFNPDSCWPPIIQYQRSIGTEFYIYRPPDRNLFFSPDLFYVDFMAGPADRYFWQPDELRVALAGRQVVVLSDTKSWEKLKISGAKVLAQDNYSSLIQSRRGNL